MTNIKEKIKGNGYNINRFAEAVGISRQAMSKIIQGGQPSIKTAKKIASLLNIDWRELYND